MKEHVIFDDYNSSPDDYADFFAELEAETGETLSDDERWRLYYDQLAIWIDDERVNLNILLNTDIIAIADLGLWNGRRTGYKIIGRNVKDILYTDCDYARWTCDQYNVRGTFIHHDGVNYVTYRAFRENVTEEQQERFCDALYNGECSPAMIRRYTRSLTPDVGAVFGWYQKRQRRTEKKAEPAAA